MNNHVTQSLSYTFINNEHILPGIAETITIISMQAGHFSIPQLQLVSSVACYLFTSQISGIDLSNALFYIKLNIFRND